MSDFYYGTTKQELLRQARELHDEAIKLDPEFCYRKFEAMFPESGGVFVWHNMTTPQLIALRRTFLAVRLMAGIT